MKKLKILFILLLVLPLTGCYNYRELSKLGITSAIGISKENGEYKLVVEVLDTQKQGEDKSPKYVLYETSGKTIQEALRNIILESSKRLYISHMQILLIDENVAKEGITDIIDFFFREPEARKEFLVLVTKDNIKDVLSTKTPLENINAQSIKEMITSNKQFLSTIDSVTFSKLLVNYTNPYKEINLPSIKIQDGDSKSLDIDNTAIFKGDKLVGYIPKEQALYLNIINNNIDDTILTKNQDNCYSSIEVTKSKTNIKIKDKTINIDVKMTANIAEIHNNVDLTDVNTISYLENIYDEEVNTNIKKTIISILNTYDSDVFGFRDIIYKNDNKNFDKNVDLKDFTINVNTNIKLQFKGNGAYNINET